MSCDVCAVVELNFFQEPSEKIHKENHSNDLIAPEAQNAVALISLR